MDTAVVGLYFVCELVRNVCHLMDDSVTSKIVFACLDIVFMVLFYFQMHGLRYAKLLRLYSFISFSQSMTSLACQILKKDPEWLTYWTISIIVIDIIVLVLVLGDEILTYRARMMQRP